MNEQELKHLIEAVLLAAGRPVTSAQMLELFDSQQRPSPEQLQAALDQLATEYETRGIELQQVASGWRILVRARCVELVSRLWQERPAKYSRALLETLALIAYRQPITRAEIEAVRGVAVSSTIMRTLQERNWIRVVGHREVPGRPEVLGTTREFLDYFGLKKLEDLPSLAALNEFETVGVQLELPGATTTSAGDLAAPAQTEGVSVSDSDAVSEAAPVNSDAEVASSESPESPEVAEGAANNEGNEQRADSAPVEQDHDADVAPTDAGAVVLEEAADAPVDSADSTENADGDTPEPRSAAAEEEEEASLLAAPEGESAHDIEEPPVGA